MSIIFFINRFNDIDHMSPIIYKISNTTQQDIHILSLNPNIDIHTDYRLKFLVKNKRVELNYFYKSSKNDFFLYMLGCLICSNRVLNINKNLSVWKKMLAIVQWFASNSARLLLFKLIKIEVTALIKKLYDENWVQELFLDKNPKILVFDPVSHPKLYNVGAVLNVAKEMLIPTIDVPHGIPLFTHHPKQWDKSKRYLVKYKKDHMVLHHQWWKNELLDVGLNPDNTPILGSARFCDEWVEILDNIIPKDNSLDSIGGEKLKVVYMEMGGTHDADISIVRDTMSKISELDFLTLVVKPQTRSNTLQHEFSNKSYIATNENSVLFSSIMIEVLIREKCFIYPRFMHTGRMIYDEYKACWPVDSYEEMEQALRKLDKDRKYIPYSKSDADNFLNEVIFIKFEQGCILDS